ncbi:hypothetical protein VTJ83DRAFT_2985 [Remersonia thermophila]|uniref:Uncharacterized protein n=1 Tax=Remersonia thermophila TaxID=72144 RepID=A0ABR4DEZ8_9PEZI
MADEGRLIQSVESRILDLPPSCVEFCPAHPSYFVVGTYSLQTESPESPEKDDSDEEDEPSPTKKPQNRNGSIVAFRLTDGGIAHIQTVPQPSALLDLRFNPHQGSRDIFAAVSSTATLAVFRFCPDDDDEPQPIQHLHTMDITAMSRDGSITPSAASEKGEILFLSFGWHPARADMLALTTNTGHVYLVHLPAFDGSGGGGWTLEPEPVITHSLETWCVALSSVPGAPGAASPALRVYSGGDDSALRFQTCRWDGEGPVVWGGLPAAVDKRGHDAGVTAILPLLLQEDGSELVVTGSYDEHIRLFEVPLLGRIKKVAELGLGGGVWRLKLIHLDRRSGQEGSWSARILASCMHAGARIVELQPAESGELEFRVLARFEEHKSMNYGSDVQPGWQNKDRLSVVSTSFYDKLLCSWEF